MDTFLAILIIFAAIALNAIVCLSVVLRNEKATHRTVTPMWIGAPVIEHDTVHVRMSFRTPHEDAAGMQ